MPLPINKQSLKPIIHTKPILHIALIWPFQAYPRQRQAHMFRGNKIEQLYPDCSVQSSTDCYQFISELRFQVRKNCTLPLRAGEGVAVGEGITRENSLLAPTWHSLLFGYNSFLSQEIAVPWLMTSDHQTTRMPLNQGETQLCQAQTCPSPPPFPFKTVSRPEFWLINERS